MVEEEKKFFSENVQRSTSEQTDAENVSLKTETNIHPKKNIYKVVLLGMIFLFLYSSNNAFDTMISQMYFQMGYFSLGNLTLIAMCFSVSLSAILAPFAAKFFPFKISMFFCSISFIFLQFIGAFTCFCNTEREFMLCNETLIYFVNIFFAVIMGFFIVILWICQCGYTTNLCDENHKSLYFGTFSCIFQLSILFGALITATIMDFFQNQFLFFCVCLGITIAAAFSFLCLPHVESLDFVEEAGLIEKIKELYALFKRRDKISISSISFFCGMEIGFWLGNLFRFVELTLSEELKDEETNAKTAWVFAVLGFFEIFGAGIATLCGDRLKKYTLVIFANSLIFISFGIALALTYTKSYGFCFLIAGFLGTGDAIIQIMINALVSTAGNNIMHFSHYVFIQNLGVVTSILLGLTLPTFIDIILMLSLQIILFGVSIYFKTNQ